MSEPQELTTEASGTVVAGVAEAAPTPETGARPVLGQDGYVDPRFQRSHDALASVMLDLAATRPAEQISVNELARGAGVARQTFYRHAGSTAEFLAQLLLEDLRPLGDHLVLTAADPASHFTDVWRDFYLAALGQVRARSDIYRVIVAERSSVFDALLSFFEDSATRFIVQVTSMSPRAALDAEWLQLAALQQAGNIAAIIRTWVSTGMVLEPEDLVDRFMTLAPPWQLARRDASGAVDLQGVRGRRG